MKRSSGIALITTAVLALGLGGLATASGSSPDPHMDDFAGPGSHQSSAVRPHTDAPDVIVQNQFVPITPCRLADTRHASAGALVAGATRQLLVAGDGGDGNFSGQGGNANGCGIPTGANAVAAGITATASKGTGYLHAWQANQSEPAATLLNFTDLSFGGITVNAPIPVFGGAGFYGLSLKAYGAGTDAVVDVFGYYIEPIAASINANGSIASESSQLVKASRTSPGRYALIFDQEVNGCAVQVTPSNPGMEPGVFTIETEAAVSILNSAQAYTDAAFTITVTC